MLAIWGIAALATGGVILRPWRLPEAVWAVAGAVILVATGLLPLHDAWTGVLKGTDVYLFLTGMMLLAEIARREGLFDWLAAHAARSAHGSGARLFTLVYAVGTIVTIFMSNDATAVVLTPAVAAIARKAEAKDPLPYLLVCAFIANAASFVLPISNPANLVIYGTHMPPLLAWLPRYALPSVAAIGVTYAVLRVMQRRSLQQEVASEVEVPALGLGGKVAAAGIALTAAALMTASALDAQLGLPTAIAGALTAAVVLIINRSSPMPALQGISWGVLPLVAGLFVLVQALGDTGVIHDLANLLHTLATRSATRASWLAGVALAFVCNIMNNLPAGLIAGSAVQQAQVAQSVTGAVLIGVDLGPNLSVTGSLATILWLTVLRREGLSVSAGTFLKIGALAMPLALVAALAALSLGDML